MDELVRSIITGVPNLAFAAWALYYLSKQNTVLITKLTELLDKLLDREGDEDKGTE